MSIEFINSWISVKSILNLSANEKQLRNRKILFARILCFYHHSFHCFCFQSISSILWRHWLILQTHFEVLKPTTDWNRFSSFSNIFTLSSFFSFWIITIFVGNAVWKTLLKNKNWLSAFVPNFFSNLQFFLSAFPHCDSLHHNQREEKKTNQLDHLLETGKKSAKNLKFSVIQKGKKVWKH